ncbi:MAG: acyl-CoA dehydrogenase family protein [Desulfofustis sp.]|nr:acyl-CoA dehydrogenase family protein [Desulfofustis sp.]
MQIPKNSLDTYDQIREMTAAFAREQIRPQAERLDRDETFPVEIFKQMADLGLFGITTEEEFGGAGVDCYAYAIIMEELSRGYSAVADQCGLVELICTLLSRYGSAEQKALYLRRITAFDLRVAYCLTEAEAGSDLAGLKTTAVKTGSGWSLTGSKLWINNAPFADIGLVLARTDPEKGHRGMSVFIVDLHGQGVTRGPKEHKMGQRASQIGPLFFDQVQLPEEALLGEMNRGFYMIMSVLEKGRVGIGALALGIAQAGLDAALDYAKTRKQFGSHIATFQGVQWMLAQMAMEISAARALVHQAAIMLDHNTLATAACSMAKCFASDVAVRQSAEAVQIFGGSGYIQGYEVERLYRDAKITQIYEGTNQIQRTIIARQLLK